MGLKQKQSPRSGSAMAISMVLLAVVTVIAMGETADYAQWRHEYQVSEQTTVQAISGVTQPRNK